MGKSPSNNVRLNPGRCLDLGHGVVVTSMHPLQRLDQIRAVAGANVVQDDVFGWFVDDTMGNVSDVVGGQVQCFSNDQRQRLVSAYTNTSGNGGCVVYNGGGSNSPYLESFGYSSVGNVTSVSHKDANGVAAGRVYSYNASGVGSVRPHAVNTVSGGWVFGYDSAGFQTSRTVPAGQPGAGVRTLAWDNLGRLCYTAAGSVVSDCGAPPANAERYVYGVDGQRLVRVEGAGASAKRTLYLDGQELVSVNGATPTGTRFYQAGDATIGVRTAAGLRYVLSDRQASTSVTVDAVTMTTERQRYYPYGAKRGGNTITTTDRGFLDQTEDDTTGLNYLNARYQDPVLGMFVSVDPLVAMTRQAYVYGSMNPVVFIDPSGLFSFRDAIGWGRGITKALDEGRHRMATVRSYEVSSVKRMLASGSFDPVGFVLEQASAQSAILVEGGELYTGGSYCGRVAECITGVANPKGESGAITLGHTIRFGGGAPGEAFVAHEVQHVFDEGSLGAGGFYAFYGGEWAFNFGSRSSSTRYDAEASYEALYLERRANRVQGHYAEGWRPSRDGPVDTTVGTDIVVPL